VELACAELGIAEDGPRGLTITGGLPYFGGPGNNYVMHSIVTMMEKLRAQPGAYGLCTGNGWYVTKHSAGIYSTKPVQGRWQREDPKSYQRDLDAMPHPEFIEQPSGRGTVETYTVVTDRKGKRFGIVIGRDAQNRRFLANTPGDDATLDGMMREEMLGRAGEVIPGTPTNLFRFDAS
jgi:acetyl-CoA C-acetyltransferase